MLTPQHVRAGYEELRLIARALLRAFPTLLAEPFFDRAAYFWAVELWYSYTMQVLAVQHWPATASSACSPSDARSASIHPMHCKLSSLVRLRSAVGI